MFNTLLQIVDTQLPTEATQVSFLDLIVKGGWVMIPLLILSVVAIGLFIERFLTISSAKKMSKTFMEDVKEKVLAGDIAKAKEICKTEDTPIARMIEKGVSRIGNPLKDIEVAIENAGKIEINRLENNLSTLATIAGAGPMIGFLGTVIGMINSFMVMAQNGGADVAGMAGGIYEAMITTAGGLIVGLVAYIAYNYLSSLLQKIVYNMEFTSVDFIDLLQEPTN